MEGGVSGMRAKEIEVFTKTWGCVCVYDYGDFVLVSPTEFNIYADKNSKVKPEKYDIFLEEVREELQKEGIFTTAFEYDPRLSYRSGEDVYRAEVLRRVDD
mgnify:CR=1 FL=1